MADMDRRLQDVEVGAGQTEARLNQEFVDFLKKWGPTLLLAVAIVAGLYVGWQRYQEYQTAQLDAAWGDLDAALGSANPASLIDIAETHPGKVGVVLFARTRAADLYLQSAIAGVAPGATTKPDGSVENPDDVLTPERREQMLSQAAEQYRLVIAASEGDTSKAIQALGGLFGMAAVEESRSQWDAARGFYERAKALATQADLPDLTKVAERRISSLEEIKKVAALPTEASVRSRAAAPPVIAPSEIQLPQPAPLGIEPVAPPAIVPPPATPVPAPAPVPDPTPKGG